MLKPLLKPAMQPVLKRLEQNEKLLMELKAAIETQRKDTAQIQAQLDILVRQLLNRRS